MKIENKYLNKEFLFSYVRKLIKHRTVENVWYLTIGHFFSQIISFIGAFYIPKLLGPEQYGIYSTVTAYVAMFAVLTFNGMTRVVVREMSKTPERSVEILEDTIGLRNLFSLLATIICVVVVFFVDYKFGIKIYIVFYSTSLLLKGTQDSIKAIFQSYQKMKSMALVGILEHIINVPLTILFLYLGYGVLSVIILKLLTDIITTLLLYKLSGKIVKFKFLSKAKFLKEYIFSGGSFSLLLFLNVISGRVDIFMLSFLITPENVGIYALAFRLVDKGLLLRGPMSISLFPYYANKFAKKRPNISLLIKHTVLIFLPLTLFLIPALLFIKPLIAIVIGIKFIKSAEIFNVLVFYLIFNFCVIPWGLTLQTTSKERFSILTVSVCAVLNVVLNLVFFKIFGMIGIAYSTLVVEMFRLLLTVYLVKIKT